MKKIVIIGATSVIANHCAKIWIKESVNITLVGRSHERLKIISHDLSVRNNKSIVSTKVLRFMDLNEITRTVSQIFAEGVVDIVLIAHGFLPDQTKCQSDLNLNKEVLEINGISPALFAEAFVQQMALANRGMITIIGSIAGDRGKKSNYVYGAAKAMLSEYARGLQHRLAQTNIQVLLIKPGPTDTPMTRKIKAHGLKLADPQEVAKQIVAAINKSKSGTLYTPAKWQIIMLVIQHLPSFIFNKLKI